MLLDPLPDITKVPIW